MAEFVNPSFELAEHSEPGGALGWTLSGDSSVYQFAGYFMAENLFSYSEALDNAYWTKTGASITADAVDAPTGYGDQVADDLVEDSSTGSHMVERGSIDGGAGRFRFAVFAKASNRSFVFLQINQDPADWGAVIYDLSAGAVALEAFDDFGSVDAVSGIESVGGGWYLCWIEFDIPTGTTSREYFVGAASSSSDTEYTGASQSALYLFGLQTGRIGRTDAYVGTANGSKLYTQGVEGFEFAWSNDREVSELDSTELDVALYDTTATAETFEATAGWDSAYLTELATKADAAYVDEQNLAYYADDFGQSYWTKTNCSINADAVSAPARFTGAQADALVDTVADDDHRVTQAIASLGAGDGTFSVYLKKGSEDWAWLRLSTAYAWFNLSTGVAGSTAGSPDAVGMEGVGGGWYRCWVSDDFAGGLDQFSIGASDADGSSSYVGTGAAALYMYGAQVVRDDDPGPLTVTTSAQVDTTGPEDLEAWWYNWPQEFAPDGTEVATYDSGADSQDTFAASDGWDAGYETTIGSSSAASYDSGGTPETVEDFEEVKDRQAFTVTPGSDDLNATSHGFVVNDRCSVESDGQLPPGLSPAPLYYVQAQPDANTFRVALVASAGSPIDITDYGFGTHWVYADPTEYWIQEFDIP